MVAPKGPLLAKEVLEPDIKAAEDLDFWPLTTTPASIGACSMLHAPYQPSNLTLTKLIVFRLAEEAQNEQTSGGDSRAGNGRFYS